MNPETLMKIEVEAPSLPLQNALAWMAMSAARNRNLATSVHENWTSDDVDLSRLLYKNHQTIWQDIRSDGQFHDHCVASEEVVISAARYRREVNASVYAKTPEIAKSYLRDLRVLFTPATKVKDLLDVTFWHYSKQHGPQSQSRLLTAPVWETIEKNYPEATRPSLTRLLEADPSEASGKLILWQGDPGTGKTFALRALGQHWSTWCTIHYILDPENFLREGDYLMRVIMADDCCGPSECKTEDKKSRWRLIVLEDSGELLSKDAKTQVGQGLSRLLNLTEGLVGQGLNVLVLITTNENVGTFHDAVSRPGRCLSQINFDRFTPEEARAWLKSDPDISAVTGEVKGRFTLAELFTLKGGDQGKLSIKLPVKLSSAGFK